MRTKAPAKRNFAKPKASPPIGHKPDRFTYALKQHTVEIRTDGWWLSKTHPSIPGNPSWSGPFPSIEDVCLAIARELATEVANRHSVLVGHHKVQPGEPLYGFKSTTTLRSDRSVA